MKLLLDANGNVVVRNGFPVYVDDAGKEIEFDAVGATRSIASLKTEAKTNRERAEAAETKAATFDGIADPELARKALKVVENLDQKKLLDAQGVETLKSEITKAYDVKLAAEKERADKATTDLHSEVIGGSFSRSKYIAEKLSIPVDMVQNTFGKSFKYEDGKVVAYGPDGNKVHSKSNPGELAGFDEAIGLIIDAYPYKDHILKSDQNGGGGTATNNGGKANANQKVVKRAAFDAMTPTAKSAHMSGGGTVVD